MSTPSARVAWIDARAGLAGDMLCAALLDASGRSEALLGWLDEALAPLGLGGYQLRLDRVRRGVIAGLRFVVQLDEERAPSWPRGQDHAHDHGHTHGHAHDHGHDHGHAHDHGRDYAEIRALLTQRALPPGARERALRAFAALAEAEARVHGVPVERVGFHEVGAIDSIVDIVSACLLLDALGVQTLVASPLPLGGGVVRTAHGPLSVPVPAVVDLLRGWPCFQDGREGELVTPTGAALVRALARPGPMPDMLPQAVGYGAGTRNPPGWNNVTRVVLGLAPEQALARPPEEIEVLETQVDDLPGEWLPPLLEALFAAGALDAWATPVLMKKGRPGLWVSALAPAASADTVALALLRHSSSFGLRRRSARRQVLERHHQEVRTPFGPVRVKVGRWEGEVLHASPEHEDCAQAARAAGVPVAEVYRAAQSAWMEGRPWP